MSRRPYIADPKTRLLANRQVTANGCWEWTGGRSRKGYGKTSHLNMTTLTHRLSAALFLGFKLSSTKQVLHRCDNPPCFNPEHLFIGTSLDNVRDRDAKGRGGWACGEDAGPSRMTEEKVREMRREYAAGATQAELSRKYGVTARKIVLGLTWKHIPFDLSPDHP